MKRKARKIGLAIGAALLGLVCMGMALCLGACLLRRGEALGELRRSEGAYDPRSIVLRSVSHGEAQRLAQLYGAQLRITEDGSYARLMLPEGTTVYDAFARWESLAHIHKMSPDYRARAAELIPARPEFTVPDPDYALQTCLDYMNLENVWEHSRGSGIRVAVIDTGIDTDHPEFAGRISEYSYNATEDKVVKDHGWGIIEDQQGHGTAVAGVIAAAMDGAGTVGIAPEVELVIIKAESDSSGEFLRISDLVFGLYYAIEQDVRIVNMSFSGSEPENLYEKAAQLAREKNVLCLAAAGNEGTAALSWPAADPNVIGVGSIDENWALAEYSNYGENLELVAPGTVLTTQMGGGYKCVNGTSFSCPMVAASVALLMSWEGEAADGEKLRELLFAACRDLGTPGRDWEYGFGIPDVSALVQGERGTVTFDMGTGPAEHETLRFLRGIPLQQLPEPERQGTSFEGWYYDGSFTRAYRYFEDTFQEDLTLYAKWADTEDVPYTYAVLEDGTVEIRSYTGTGSVISVPEEIDGRQVSAIGDFAFENRTGLGQVKLPSGLTVIGRGAFRGCSSLTQIHIPDSVTRIREEAFRDAVGLETLSFGRGSKLEALEGYVFAGCASLRRVELPASLRKADGTDFLGAVSLERITVAAGNSKFSHKDGVLFNAKGDTLVVYPAARGSHYQLPTGTVRIGDYAFGCGALDTVELTGLEKLGKNAFLRASLREVAIPDTVNRIGEYAFAQCPKLENVKLGGGITIIPEGMFQYAGVKTVLIPAGIKKIQAKAFQGSGLEEVAFEAGSILEQIGDEAFSWCALKSVSLPAAVQTIGNEAFRSCGLEQLEIASGSRLSEIGEKAFWECGLKSFTVPALVTKIGGGAFGWCSGLNAIVVAEGNAVYKSVDGVLMTLDDRVLHTFPAGKAAQSYPVPETVTGLMAYSFAGTGKLEKLVICEGIGALRNDALRDGGFSALELPESLSQIGEYALAGTFRLKSISLPAGLEKLGRYAFLDSTVETVDFGSGTGLLRIGAYAFAGSGIRELTVPDSVRSIGANAFENCENLMRLSLPEGLTHPESGGHTHRYKAVVTEPDCLNGGFTTYSCACGDSYVDEPVAALGHDVEKGVCLRCGETGLQRILPGDADENGTVNYRDALAVLLFSIGLRKLSDGAAEACDMDGNGRLNYVDALAILKISIGL